MKNKRMAEVVLMVLLLFISIRSLAVEKGIVIGPKDHVISPKECLNYVERVVTPILKEYSGNEREIPGIRHRLVKFGALLQEGKAEYAVVPAYHPYSRTIAAMTFWDFEHMPVIYLFVPAVQDLQKRESPRNFRDLVAIIFSHEIIHLETDRPNHEVAENEAVAWGITILEIIRPLERQGRRPYPQAISASELLKTFGDNFRHPLWIEHFRRLKY